MEESGQADRAHLPPQSDSMPLPPCLRFLHTLCIFWLKEKKASWGQVL